MISDDGDGTYSAQQTNYCFLRYANDANSPCGFNYAIVDGRLIVPGVGSSMVSVHIKRISDTRLLISDSSGSVDFNLIRLDKKNLSHDTCGTIQRIGSYRLEGF